MAPEDDDLAFDALDEHRAREDFGITTHEMGSFMPEGSYRPLPIVWLGGAWFLQIIVLFVLMIALNAKAPIFLVATAALASVTIGHWTWTRGMSRASFGWRALTIGALAFNWGWVTLAAYGRELTVGG